MSLFDSIRLFSAPRALSVITHELRALRKLYECHLLALGVALPLTRAEQRAADALPAAPPVQSEEQAAEERAIEILRARARGEIVEGPGADWEP